MNRILLVLLLVLIAVPSRADTITPKAALERLFTSDAIKQEWFAPVFLAQVSLDQVRAIVTQVGGQLGKYQRVELPATNSFSVVFEKGSVPATIHLDDQGRIDGLFFRPAVLNGGLTPKAALERLFVNDKLQPEWFAASVLGQIPLSQLQAIVDQLKSNLGAYKAVTEDGGAFSVEFEHGSVPSTIGLDADGRIVQLFFKPPVLKGSGVKQALEQFKALPGTVSVLVLRDGSDVVAANPGASLAVGSTFKLAVLNALRAQIATGKHAWGEAVRLRPEWKSLPSGILQTWPSDAQLTIYSLAALMISQSDNTAADTLAHLVGRASVEAYGEARNRPYLTTRELFILKAPANADLLARYRKGGVAERRAVVAATAKRPLPSVAIFTGVPLAPDIEWFFATRELCALMKGVAELPLMGINPGVANRAQWKRIAFKGGSEPGVLNLTTMVTAANGASYCVSATWNDSKALDERKFEIVYGELLASLK